MRLRGRAPDGAVSVAPAADAPTAKRLSPSRLAYQGSSRGVRAPWTDRRRGVFPALGRVAARRSRRLLTRKLRGDDFRIRRAVPQQFSVPTDGDQRTAVEHRDLIGIHDG